MTKEEIIKKLEKVENEVSDRDFWLVYCESVTRVINENQKLQQEKENLINWLGVTIEDLECDDYDDEGMKGYLIQRRSDFKEILEKVKSGKYE